MGIMANTIPTSYPIPNTNWLAACTNYHLPPCCNGNIKRSLWKLILQNCLAESWKCLEVWGRTKNEEMTQTLPISQVNLDKVTQVGFCNSLAFQNLIYQNYHPHRNSLVWDEIPSQFPDNLSCASYLSSFDYLHDHTSLVHHYWTSIITEHY